MRITVLCTVALLAFAGPSWATEEPGKGKGTETAPGQAKQEQGPAEGHAKGQDQAAKPSQPAKPAKPQHSSKPKPKPKPSKPAKAAKPKPSKGSPAPAAPKSSNGMAHKKTTICHATGSATNPYVTITISNAALKAHDRHQDGRDIIPAPAGGCPKPATAAAPATPEKADDKPEAAKTQEKVTLCHSTGSATNPYVVITVDSHAVKAHEAHHDGRDIIPAPAGGCPAAAAAAPAVTTPAPSTATLLTAPVAQSGPLAALSAPAPSAAKPRSVVSNGTGAVLGEQVTAPAADTAAAPEVLADRESGAGTADTAGAASLPFTGMDTWLLLAAGLAFLLGGFALRRASATR